MKVTIHTSEVIKNMKYIKITWQQLIDIGSGKIVLAENSADPLYKELMDAEIVVFSDLYEFGDAVKRGKLDNYEEVSPIFLREEAYQEAIYKAEGFVLIANKLKQSLNLKKVIFNYNNFDPQYESFDSWQIFDELYKSFKKKPEGGSIFKDKWVELGESYLNSLNNPDALINKINNHLVESLTIKEIVFQYCYRDYLGLENAIETISLLNSTFLVTNSVSVNNTEERLEQIKKFESIKNSNGKIYHFIKMDNTLEIIRPSIIKKILCEYLFSPKNLIDFQNHYKAEMEEQEKELGDAREKAALKSYIKGLTKQLEAYNGVAKYIYDENHPYDVIDILKGYLLGSKENSTIENATVTLTGIEVIEEACL